MCRVGVSGGRCGDIDAHSQLPEEVLCELVASRDLKGARVQGDVLSNIEVLHGVEFIIIWWRFGDTVTTDKGAWLWEITK